MCEVRLRLKVPGESGALLKLAVLLTRGEIGIKMLSLSTEPFLYGCPQQDPSASLLFVGLIFKSS